MESTAQTSNARPGRKARSVSLASLGLRCAAFLLDYILTMIVPALTLIIAVLIKRRWDAPSIANGILILGYLATAGLIYFNLIYLYVERGQSLGKNFIGLRVERLDGAKMDYKTASIRHLAGYPLSILCFGLGIIWSFWDRKQQGWHDKLAKTIVVKI
jgi:uncharacterized RDD family membrane protein YckC